MSKLLEVAIVPRSITQFLLPLADHFRDRGWRVDATANGITSDPLCRAHFDHVWSASWTRNPLHHGNLVPQLRVLRTLVEREQYDIVHVHTPIAGFLTRLALRRLRAAGRVKIVYTVHGFHFHDDGRLIPNLVYTAAEKLAGRWTDALVVINRQDEAAARRYRLVPEDRLYYMPGIGIDTARYSRDAVPHEDVCRVRQELGVEAETPVFVCVAEMVPRKRHGDLLEAFAALPRRDAHLMLVGDGPMEASLQEHARRLGIADRTHFKGYRHDIPALVSAAQALVLVSEQEGLPRCVMEALSLETPVIATRIRGTEDLVAGVGSLVRLRDRAAITEATERVLENPLGARAAAHEGRKRMIAKHEERDILRMYDRLFADLLDA